MFQFVILAMTLGQGMDILNAPGSKPPAIMIERNCFYDTSRGGKEPIVFGNQNVIFPDGWTVEMGDKLLRENNIESCLGKLSIAPDGYGIYFGNGRVQQ